MPPPKPVYIMPRLRLSSGRYGQREVRIGRAEFWPDDDSTWANVIGKPRPAWLDIYRDFPAGGNEEPDVARGTLLVSSDDEWLRQNAQKVVPVLFVLGYDGISWETPAEAFHYTQYEATDEPAALVSLMTKYGPVTEDAGSLQLLPPLGLRGLRSVTVRFDDPFKTELVRRFDQNPDDRIVAACRHLFRTQFSDPFFAPFDQDEAAYCSCLEAVFALESNQREIGRELGRRVAAVYSGLVGLGEWIEGLYLHRCDFVHGDTDASQASAPPHIQRVYDSFEERRGRWTVLRSLSLDLIRREAERTMIASPPHRLYNREADLVRAYFTADALWAAVRRPFEATNAAATINGLAGDDLTRFCGAVTAFLGSHRWDCMVQLPGRGRVVNVIRSVAMALMNCPAATQEEQRDALAVSRAAASNQDEGVRDWVAHHEDWREWGRFERPMAEYLKASLLHIARFYDEQR